MSSANFENSPYVDLDKLLILMIKMKEGLTNEEENLFISIMVEQNPAARKLWEDLEDTLR